MMKEGTKSDHIKKGKQQMWLPPRLSEFDLAAEVGDVVQFPRVELRKGVLAHRSISIRQRSVLRVFLLQGSEDVNSHLPKM